MVPASWRSEAAWSFAHEVTERSAARRPRVALHASLLVDQYAIAFDLPGIDPDALDVDVERNTLTVKAERRPLPRSESAQTDLSERPLGSLRAAFDHGRAASPAMSPLGRRDGRSWSARQGAEPLIRSRGE
ncbi:Hsp20/alpha crystallin family protein [Streptomyces sp. NPDC057094]|uniref:Hsp20/alpha crystallin family protein n=1 Tax=Streptomyces sp. NPDC057094 TaxID=3346018 RepID=UPI00363D0485